MIIAKIRVNATTGVCVNRRRIPAGLVGGTVAVEFADPIWNKLAKTVVFRGNGSYPAKFDGSLATIPWEAVSQPGHRLFFGIWGSDPDSGLQLPLIEVDIGVTETSTDPEATPGTDPTLPIWAQLQAEIAQLKQSGVSEEKIAQVVEAYLAKNPPTVTETDPTVSDWAKQPEKPSYTADEVGALSKTELSGAVNDALAQAKESGEFDGKDGYTPVKGKDYFDGEPGQPGAPGKTPVKGTDYYTEADKAEMVNSVLAALPTWTGGSY